MAIDVSGMDPYDLSAIRLRHHILLRSSEEERGCLLGHSEDHHPLG